MGRRSRGLVRRIGGPPSDVRGKGGMTAYPDSSNERTLLRLLERANARPGAVPAWMVGGGGRSEDSRSGPESADVRLVEMIVSGCPDPSSRGPAVQHLVEQCHLEHVPDSRARVEQGELAADRQESLVQADQVTQDGTGEILDRCQVERHVLARPAVGHGEELPADLVRGV